MRSNRKKPLSSRSRLFDRQDEYLRDWIKVDGYAWIARRAVVAVEVWKDTDD